MTASKTNTIAQLLAEAAALQQAARDERAKLAAAYGLTQPKQ